MAKYELPRFMSREEWEALSLDNLYWLENAAAWIKCHPLVYDDGYQLGDCTNKWMENWAMINFSHPDNAFKRGQESLYTYGKRIHSDYRKMYGVT